VKSEEKERKAKKRKEKIGVFTNMPKVNMVFCCSIPVSHHNTAQRLHRVGSLFRIFF
jgi:hypothetical protein